MAIDVGMSGYKAYDAYQKVIPKRRLKKSDKAQVG